MSMTMLTIAKDCPGGPPPLPTTRIAERLIELCSRGQFIQAQHELYAPDVVSIGPDGLTCEATADLRYREQRYVDSSETIFSIRFTTPIVTGDYFVTTMLMETGSHPAAICTITEIWVIRVRNGRIVFEQCFRENH